ncbi:unnamed protein product [Alternaria alternata]
MISSHIDQQARLRPTSEFYTSTSFNGAQVSTSYGDVEKVVHITYGDEISETPYGLIRKCVDDVTSQRISWKLKSVAQKHRSIDYHVQFLPSSSIGKVLGKSAVLLELSRHKAAIPKGAEPDKYQKILAVLYLTKMPNAIGTFVTAGASDAYLPFDEATVAVDGGHRVGLRSRRQPDICCAPFVDDGDTRSFLQQQWSVIAHVFDKAEGNHWNKDRKSRNVFAIKVLNDPDANAYKQELKVLEKLNKSTHAHEHLIKLLAAYEQSNTYHLVFPWADCDLFDYWKRNPTPDKNATRAAWMAKQCQGLAEALNRIHHYNTLSGSLITSVSRLEQVSTPKSPSSATEKDPFERRFFGRHGDLKPENIIWFPDSRSIGGYGILKIADFGTTEFSTEYSKRGIVPNSLTYRSPEYELDKTHGIACDIWALGCIFLEFATWYFGGLKALTEFNEHRLDTDRYMAGIPSDTFFVIRNVGHAPRAEVKPAILKKIDVLYSIQSLERHIPTKDFFQTLLNLIRCDMLVINHGVDSNLGSFESQQVEHEEHVITSLARAMSDSLPIPDRSSTRRKSSGDIFRALGNHSPIACSTQLITPSPSKKLDGSISAVKPVLDNISREGPKDSQSLRKMHDLDDFVSAAMWQLLL